jgi:hypothetical protein
VSARAEALTEEEQASPLAKRIYDLRHACLSLRLNAGVPPTQVAAWAGHSVEVLLRIYAKCIDGQDAIAVPPMTLIAPFARVTRSTNRSTSLYLIAHRDGMPRRRPAPSCDT